jgi:hypothetical protein
LGSHPFGGGLATPRAFRGDPKTFYEHFESYMK